MIYRVHSNILPPHHAVVNMNDARNTRGFAVLTSFFFYDKFIIMKKKGKKHHCNKELFESEVKELLKNPEVRRMSEFTMHRGKSTLEHVLAVAKTSFRIADRLGLDIDEKALARGAILHDLYLYTFFDSDISAFRHGIGHPETALQNARKIVNLTEKEENIIRSHMWPLTPFHPPRSKEAFLVMLADKICATKEVLSP